ncbi:hypothetical protein [Orrella marina]|uniref:hypothetical protein n=1 Tax=Orrella marina TaxID=2163011 RepID=UPI00187F7726|nr:hypothetical protein [Orrella marina]
MELQSFVVERFQDGFQLLQNFGFEMWAVTVGGDMGAQMFIVISPVSSPSLDQRCSVANARLVCLLPIEVDPSEWISSFFLAIPSGDTDIAPGRIQDKN